MLSLFYFLFWFRSCHLHSKYVLYKSDHVEHVMILRVKNIWSIATLRYNYDVTTEDVPIEMFQFAINTLHANSITLEEADIGHFT